MHLTNYSLNKLSKNFKLLIEEDKITEINDASNIKNVIFYKFTLM